MGLKALRSISSRSVTAMDFCFQKPGVLRTQLFDFHPLLSAAPAPMPPVGRKLHFQLFSPRPAGF